VIELARAPNVRDEADLVAHAVLTAVIELARASNVRDMASLWLSSPAAT